MVADKDGDRRDYLIDFIDQLGSYSRWIIGFVVFTLVGALLASLFWGVIAFIMGDIERATSYASFTSGLSTVLLVLLTGWYALHTRSMVDETRRSREEDQRENERRRRCELDSLRRALYEEISKIEGLTEYADDYQVASSLGGFPAPTTIYRRNAGKIGLLTDEETDAIVEYYARVEIIQNYMELQRELDTTVGMDAVTEYFRRTQVLVDFFLRKLSLGRLGKKGASQRTEYIRDQIRELAGVQEEALEAIEKYLDESGEDRERDSSQYLAEKGIDNTKTEG